MARWKCGLAKKEQQGGPRTAAGARRVFAANKTSQTSQHAIAKLCALLG